MTTAPHMTTPTLRHPWMVRSARVAAVAMLAISVPVGVHADQFTPIPAPPVVIIQSAPGGSVTAGSTTTTLANIQPKYADSAGNFAVTAATGDGTTATLTASGHSFAVGDWVTVSGVTGYSGTVEVTGVAGSRFSFASSTNTTSSGLTGQVRLVSSAVTAASVTSGVATLTAAGHNFIVGDVVTVSGVTGYDGDRTVTAVSGSTFSFALASGSTLTGITGGRVRCKTTCGADTGVYTVTATVSTNATLAALATVSMCWYRTSAGGDTNCAVLNPGSAFEMVWTEVTAAAANAGAGSGTAGFAVSTKTPFSTNNYQNSGSQVETTPGSPSYDKNAQSMTIKFSFRVSSAMLAGSDWAVRVTAIYDTNLCGGSSCTGLTSADLTGSDTETARSVNYWGQITTARERMGFGVIAENGTSDTRSMTSFEYVANATSDYGLVGTDFRYDVNDENAPVGTDTLALVGGTGTGASGLADKQVRLECAPMLAAGTPPDTPATFGDYVRVDTDGERLGATLTATGETPETSGAIECRLSYSSGAANALQIYSSQVTLSILQKSV